jgi:predicted DCC family thiol-disulfide oxidoreductase YuxK
MKLPGLKSEPAPPREGWILYDGGCGFCFRWVHFWKNVVEPRGFAIKDLQSASADGSLQVPQENLLDDIRGGKLESGADAYLYVTRRIWWAWPFYAVFSLPGLNWMLWTGYRCFNRNRYRISCRCPLPSQTECSARPKDGQKTAVSNKK